MSIDGNYQNIGSATLIELHKAAQSGKKIEASELAAIRTAAQSDNDFSEGEQALLAKLEAATKDNSTVDDFELAKFDPSDVQLKFGQMNLSISGKQGTISPAYLDGVQSAISRNNSRSDDIIRSLVNDSQKLALAAEQRPGLLVQALDVLTSGNYSDEDRHAVSTIFNALATAKQDKEAVAAFNKIVATGDDDTLRELSRNQEGLKAVHAADPAALDKAIEVLKSGWYGDDDAEAVARIVAVKTAPQQQQFTQGLTASNGSDDDDTLRKISEKPEILQNLSTDDKLRSLNVLSTGWVSGDDEAAMQRILDQTGFKGMSAAQARQLAEALEGMAPANITKFAAQWDAADPAFRTRLTDALKNMQADEAKLTLNMLVSLPPASKADTDAYIDAFLKLDAKDKQAASEVAGLLLQKPEPANLREQIGKCLKGADADRVGRALNKIGLYIPNLKLDSPGVEDATNRMRSSHMEYDPRYVDPATPGWHQAPQKDYVHDMISIAKKEGFKVNLQVPAGTDIPKLKADLVAAHPDIADVAELDKFVEIRDTTHPGYLWGEDNKWINNDNKTIVVPARGPDVETALDTARLFTGHDLGLAPTDPGYATEGHHTASKTGAVPEAWQGAVNGGDQQVNAEELGRTPGLKLDNDARTYNEGGNMLVGTLPSGQPYAVIGRDGVLTSTFLLESKFAAKPSDVPEFAPAKVKDRRTQLGLDNAPLSTENRLLVDQTLARLQSIDPAKTEDDAKNFLAKMDITKDVMAEDIGIPRNNVVFVPQPEFHVDMFMRPLGPGQILVNDYGESVKLLEAAKKKAVPGSWEDKEIDSMIADAKAKQAAMQPIVDEIVKQLGASGMNLDVRRVPGSMEGKMDSHPLETRHVNFMNAIPGTSTSSNQQYYITNYTSIKPLREAFEDYIKGLGVEKVYWVGDEGGGQHSKSASEQSLDDSGGLDCRDNHAMHQQAVDPNAPHQA